MSKITKEAIEEEVSEIQEENKDLYKIMETDLYKALFQIFKRCTIKVEIQNIDQISSGPGEKSTTKKIAKKDQISFIDASIIKDYSEKAYKLRNEDDQFCFVPKSAIEKIDDKRLYLTNKAKNWYIPEWKDDE